MVLPSVKVAWAWMMRGFMRISGCRSGKNLVGKCGDVHRTISGNHFIALTKDRKFIELWLRRARKELAISGRMAELTHLLELQEQGDGRDWHRDLLRLLQGEWEPSMDDLIRLDGVLARPRPTPPSDPGPTLL